MRVATEMHAEFFVRCPCVWRAEVQFDRQRVIQLSFLIATAEPVEGIYCSATAGLQADNAVDL